MISTNPNGRPPYPPGLGTLVQPHAAGRGLFLKDKNTEGDDDDKNKSTH